MILRRSLTPTKTWDVDTLTVDSSAVVANPVSLIRYQYSDHLGSATLETNAQAQMISYEEYHPYGTTAYSTYVNGNYSTKRYRFTNKERDDETGLYYFGVRYYAAWLGRWTSSDPGGFVDGFNLYRYTRNNPINGIDREGYSTEDVEPPPQLDQPDNNELNLVKAQWIIANDIAREGMERFGNNAGSNSFGYKVFSELFGLEGYQAKEERTENLLGFFEEQLESWGYEEGTARHNHMYRAIALMYEQNAYISKYTNMEEGFNNLLDEQETISSKFDVLLARSNEVIRRDKSLKMIGLILDAYGASYFGATPIAKVSPKGYSLTYKYKDAIKVDLMGGRTGTKGYINYDQYATKGIADDVSNFNKHFGKNSVDEMLVNNPQTTFLDETVGALKPGATVTVRGGMSNKYFKKVYQGKASGMNKFEVVSKKENVLNKGYKKTDGTPINPNSKINEIIIRKL